MLTNAATPQFNASNNAGLVSDNCVRTTVFLAAVRLLVGVGSSFQLHSARFTPITLGSVLLRNTTSA